MGRKFNIFIVISILISSSISGGAHAASQSTDRNASNNNIACTNTQSSKSAPTSNSRATTCTPIVTNVVISGLAKVGQTLTASVTISNPANTTTSYQWKYFFGGRYTPIGTNSPNYTILESDINKTIIVAVTVRNSFGSTTVQSSPTGTVIGISPIISGISINGLAKVGQQLTANVSYSQNAIPSPTEIYTWYSGGSPVGGSSPYYTIVSSDLGKSIWVKVDSSNSYGSSTLTSSGTSQVVSDGPTASITGVTIFGSAEVGTQLAANFVSASGQGNYSISYQWQSGGINVGSNFSLYTVQNSDIGNTITVTVTVTDDNGSASNTSSPTAVVPAPFVPFGLRVQIFDNPTQRAINLPTAVSFDICEVGNLSNCTQITSSTNFNNVVNLNLSGTGKSLLVTYHNSDVVNVNRMYLFGIVKSGITDYIPSLSPRVDFTTDGQQATSNNVYSNSDQTLTLLIFSNQLV